MKLKFQSIILVALLISVLTEKEKETEYFPVEIRPNMRGLAPEFSSQRKQLVNLPMAEITPMIEAKSVDESLRNNLIRDFNSKSLTAWLENLLKKDISKMSGVDIRNTLIDISAISQKMDQYVEQKKKRINLKKEMLDLKIKEKKVIQDEIDTLNGKVTVDETQPQIQRENTERIEEIRQNFEENKDKNDFEIVKEEIILEGPLKEKIVEEKKIKKKDAQESRKKNLKNKIKDSIYRLDNGLEISIQKFDELIESLENVLDELVDVDIAEQAGDVAFHIAKDTITTPIAKKMIKNELQKQMDTNDADVKEAIKEIVKDVGSDLADRLIFTEDMNPEKETLQPSEEATKIVNEIKKEAKNLAKEITEDSKDIKEVEKEVMKELGKEIIKDIAEGEDIILENEIKQEINSILPEIAEQVQKAVDEKKKFKAN